MSAFTTWVLGYLVNSLWEVPAIFAAGWLATRMVRRIGPELRLEHRVWVGALALEAILPACRQDLRQVLGEIAALWRHGAGRGEVKVAIGAGAVYRHGVVALPAALLTGIVVLYAGSLLYFAGRLAWGVWRTSMIGRQAERMILTGVAGASLERCRAHFSLREVPVALSGAVSGPVTVGVLRRVLLVPPEFLRAVGAGDLEAVLAHEFAHIKRRDFAKNVGYGVLALPVTYHPVLWLTRARIAESRELVCDQMAAEVVRGRERYARSLLRLASLLAGGMPARTLHAIGIFDANIFERRVMNLTQKRVEIRGLRRFAGAAACVVVGLATCASAMALRMEVAAPVTASGSGGAQANTPVRVSGGVMAGNVLSRVNPVYPPEAKEARITGAVVMSAVIDKDGLIQNLQVGSGPEELRQSALESVHQWTYKPYLLNGEPTEVQTTITVNYSLSE